MLTQILNVQVSRIGLLPTIDAVQGDSGRVLECRLTDFVIPPGSTARIYAQKPSGAKVFNTCSVSGRNVTVDLTTQMLAELGRTMCQVQVMQGEEKVTSFDFAINVVKNRVDSAAIESTDEFTALDDALAQANALLEDLANQPVAFTEAASNAYIASGDTVAELFGKIQKLFKNVFELTPLKTIPSGADLNDYTDFGCWSVASATIAATVENGPVTNSGYTLRVMRGTMGTNYIVQTVLTGLGVSYFRALVNSTWGDWEQVYSTRDIIPVSNGGTGRTTLAGSTGLLHDLFPIGRGTATYFMVMDAQWANPGYINIANMKTLLGMDNVFELNPTGTINANDDLNDYKEFGCWLCGANTVTVTLSNCPVTGGGFTLRCMKGTGGSVSQYVVQEIIDYYGRRYFRAWRDGTWDAWKTMLTDEDIIYSNAGFHNSMYRGKSLGTSVTADQYEAISSGTFNDLYIGDYWTINGVVYRIAAFDYYLNNGDTATTAHHAVIVPDKYMYTHNMNDTNTTAGGYVGSKMYTEGLEQAKTTIKAAFSGHVLKHRIYLTNAVTDGHPSAGAWCDSEVDLMSEQMVYGGPIFMAMANGSTYYVNYRVEKSQLPLFALNPSLIHSRQLSYWLRDVCTASLFALVSNTGYATLSGAGGGFGVRPAFCIS